MKYYRSIALTLVCTLLFVAALAVPAYASTRYITGEDQNIAAVAQLTNTDPDLLAAINNYEVDEGLPAGTLITLPEQPALAITVKSGDTVYALSRTYDVTVEELISANSLINPERIYPGQTLYLPLSEESAVYAYQGSAAETVQLISMASRGSSFTWPVAGIISSRFGPRDGSFHYGLDIAADTGTVITASLAGEVIEADWKNDAYGYAVMIDHGNGLQTLYGHCSELLVEAGEYVIAGQAVALVGSTGNSTGPHVHFEIRVGGECQDPLDYLR